MLKAAIVGRPKTAVVGRHAGFSRRAEISLSCDFSITWQPPSPVPPGVPCLGALFAPCPRPALAINNASTRRGVLDRLVSRPWRSRCRSVCRLLPDHNRERQLGQAGELPAGKGIRLMAAVGIPAFHLRRYCNYRAVKALGPISRPRDSALSHLDRSRWPCWCSGEKLTPLRIFGMVLSFSGRR